ncbi:hypothetical protein GA0061070_101127 [Kosakonia oryziphila]|uniref:Uncharacterized protein n=1 Tax=Kosakonia oryziphila TaxID=1005667 RepID=A0A1C4CDX7_9ENTR|nr:hypothetical protein GA0061070_101127 [Kosakonia oryziphila]
MMVAWRRVVWLLSILLYNGLPCENLSLRVEYCRLTLGYVFNIARR